MIAAVMGRPSSCHRDAVALWASGLVLGMDIAGRLRAACLFAPPFTKPGKSSFLAAATVAKLAGQRLQGQPDMDTGKLRSLLDPVNLHFHLAKLRDRAIGVDFSTVEAIDLGLDPKLSHRASSSGHLHLSRCIGTLGIKRSDTLVDIGCGKGGAMRVLLKHPFERVDGIELSEAMVDIARSNLSRLRFPADRWSVMPRDAAEFRDELDVYSHIYMFNPFFERIMKVVVDNIVASLKRKPRRLSLIYNTPRCHLLIEASRAFDLTAVHPSRGGNKINVYMSRIV